MSLKRFLPLFLTFSVGGLTLAAASGAFQQEMAMPMPTEQHKELLAGVGVWEGTMTSYMPGAPGDPVAAKETVVPVGEFWTQSRFECQFMGQPYLGTGCMGYDTAKKKYVGTWIDSSSSYLAVMEGEKDPATGHIVMRWQAPDPMTGAMVPHRFELASQKDSYSSTFYMGAGAGTKTMVIAMQRKAKGAVEAGAR